MQPKLLDISKQPNGFRDSAFAKNKELPLHRWVPWIAGFSAGFVDDCLDKYLSNPRLENRWVLDPFAGVGTTLVQAYSRGVNVVGFEINPYAALAAKTKLHAVKVSTSHFAERITAFERYMERHGDNHSTSKSEPRSKPPVGFSGRSELFSPKVERKVLFALDFINSLTEAEEQDLFRLAFGSVMVSVSNYSYEPSLTRRSAVDKPNIEDARVGALLTEKLRMMLEDILWLQSHMQTIGLRPKGKIVPESIFSASRILKRTSFVDLVVTSPPYLNNYHYPRNTRPQLHWLGFASGPGYNGAGEVQSFGKFGRPYGIRLVSTSRSDTRN